MTIKVGVFGAGGRMGATVCQAVLDAPDLELVAAVDPQHAGETVPGTGVVISSTPDAITAAGAAVTVDFTFIDAARQNMRWCAENGVHAVVGTSGFGESEVAELRELFDKVNANAVIAPNFAIGAVLMMRFAEMAAPFFDSAEIIEFHHENKIDAPSGTAVATAERMRGQWIADPTTKVVAEGARGGVVNGIPIHAVRLRGMVASQEVLLGVTGQSLTIRHDTYDRSSFMPGVLLAVRKIAQTPGLTFGLDALLDL